MHGQINIKCNFFAQLIYALMSDASFQYLTTDFTNTQHLENVSTHWRSQKRVF
jgi:hypothetical protein